MGFAQYSPKQSNYSSAGNKSSSRSYSNGSINSFSSTLNNSNITRSTGYNEYGKYGSNFSSPFGQGKRR